MKFDRKKYPGLYMYHGFNLLTKIFAAFALFVLCIAILLVFQAAAMGLQETFNSIKIHK